MISIKEHCFEQQNTHIENEGKDDDWHLPVGEDGWRPACTGKEDRDESDCQPHPSAAEEASPSRGTRWSLHFNVSLHIVQL
jgi:hypothetical protein